MALKVRIGGSRHTGLAAPPHKNIHLLNVEFFANYVHQSVSSFNRNFKRELGVTPMQYLEEIRIVKAKLMLRRMDISLTDIALHCEFGSGAYFATAFKKHVGITPSDYRKNHLEL